MLPNRKHIRMREFDYTTPGAYFVTICVDSRNIQFGTIRHGAMVLNDAGRMIQDVWLSTPTQFAAVECDSFVLMPDHLHGIWMLRPGEDFGQHPTPFIRIVQWFKSITTNAYGLGVREQGWRRFERRLWQRDYFERYLRNERELEQKRAYIDGNPGRWQERIDSLK